MTDNANDPLADADIGDTVHYETEQQMSVYDLAFDDLVGWDRELDDVRVADATIVGDDGSEELRVRIEGELRKQERPEHVPTPEEREQRRKERERRRHRNRSISLGVGLGVTSVVTYGTMHLIHRELAFAGESVSFDPTGVWATMMLVLVLAVAIILGLKGWLPGTVMPR